MSSLWCSRGGGQCGAVCLIQQQHSCGCVPFSILLSRLWRSVHAVTIVVGEVKALYAALQRTVNSTVRPPARTRTRPVRSAVDHNATVVENLCECQNARGKVHIDEYSDCVVRYERILTVISSRICVLIPFSARGTLREQILSGCRN